MRCSEGNCLAARPERCSACNGRRLRALFADTKTVPIKDINGQRAEVVRVYFPGGWFTEHEVTPHD